MHGVSGLKYEQESRRDSDMLATSFVVTPPLCSLTAEKVVLFCDIKISFTNRTLYHQTWKMKSHWDLVVYKK